MNALDRAVAWLTRGVGSCLQGDRWAVKSAAAIVVLVLFRAFPSYDALQSAFVVSKWSEVQVKLDHPFADTSVLFAPGSHESNLTYRITVPLLARCLSLSRNGLLILAGISQVVLLYTLLRLVHLAGASRIASFCLTLALGCVWPGLCGFHELRGGYYDVFALTFVALSALTAKPQLRFLCLFLALWTDERAIVAAAFLVLVAPGRRFLIPLAAALLLYSAGRAVSVVFFGYPLHATGVGAGILLDQLYMLPWSFWSGLGGAWIMVGAGVWALSGTSRMAAIGFVSLIALVAASAMMVVDTTRTFSYALPAVFVAVQPLSGRLDTARIDGLAFLALALSFPIPTVYVEGAGYWFLKCLPLQLIRVLNG